MNFANFHGSVLMNEADGGEGAGGGGVAVAEPTTALVPSGETAVATTGADGDDGAGVDPGADGALVPSGEPGTGKSAQSTALELLKSHADPEVKKFANTALRSIAARNELAKIFPGVNPITAAKQLQSDMVSLAGRHYNQPDPKDPERRTGIQQIRDRMAEFEEVDLLFYSGDPKILDGMTADDAGKAAFAKLAPAMMAKFRQIAPNAYSATVAKTFLQSMKYEMLTDDKGNAVEEADIPLRLRRLALALNPGNDANGQPLQVNREVAIGELNAIGNFVWRMQEMAKLAPEVFTSDTTAGTRTDEREQRITQRENDLRQRDWSGARQTMADQIVGKQWEQLTKGHTISAADQEDALALFRIRLDKALEAKEPKARENREAYFESDDREGYLAYEKYLLDTYGIPALKQEVTRMLGKMAPAKPGQPRPAAAPNGQRPAATPAPQGFTKLSAKPPSHMLDYSQMNADMVRNKQGILRMEYQGKKAGSKVSW